MEDLMQNIIQWYKENHYDQGDSYYINYSYNLWIVGHTNDYPMQHGKGKSVRLTTAQVDELLNR